MTEAEFELPRAHYCRIEATDAGGRAAWSNPIILEGASED
jgi:hypothetical protein